MSVLVRGAPAFLDGGGSSMLGTKGPGARVGPGGWDQAGMQISLWACGPQKAFREEVVVWGLGFVVGWSWVRSGSGGSVDLMVVRVCGSYGSNEGLWIGQFLMRVCTLDSLGSVGRIGTSSTAQVCKLIREVKFLMMFLQKKGT